MIFVTILAFLTAFWVVATILWLAIIKKQLLDPRIYVLYGLFHWLMVGQLGTLLGYNFYEVKPLFDESTHAKAAILILSSVLFFLVGYKTIPKFRAVQLTNVGTAGNLVYLGDAKSYYIMKVNCLAFLALFLGIIGHGSSLYFQKNRHLIIEYSFIPLFFTYWGVAGSVLAIYVLLLERSQRKGNLALFIKLLLLIVAMAGLFLSNVMFVFPLFYVVYSLYLNVFKSGARVRPKLVLLYAVLISAVAFWSIIFKVIVQGYLVTGELDLLTGMASVTHRWRSFDLLNSESYGIVLHSMELYTDTGQLLAGRSLLVAFPFLLFVSEDIRGFGRIIVLDIYGPSYLTMNVGWAVPPMGELVANFGYLSPPIFYFFLGIVCRYLYERFKRSSSPVYQGFYGVFLPWLFMQQRGDFLNGTVFPAYVVMLVSIAFWIARKRWPLKLHESPSPH